MTSNAQLLGMLLAIAGCGAQTASSTTSPDAGMPGDGSGSGSGTGSGSGSCSGSGSGSGAPGGPVISLAGSHVLDERGDQVDFSTGEPVHTHLGARIDLSNGCPDVYLYAYLRDRGSPPWGGETTANPLAWQVSAQSSVGIADEEYRVSTEDAQLLDWTPITGGTVALYRDTIRALGTYDGQLTVDFRVHDARGGETVATACVKYHPMAAPLEITPIVKSGEAEPLFGMTLAADAPVSHVITESATAPDVISQRFVQHSAEPITLDILLAIPGGTYAKAISDRFVRIAGGTLDCGTADTYSEDTRCSKVTHVTSAPDATFGGGLASGAWSIVLLDEMTHATASVCTVIGLHALCTIPPRAIGAVPHGYRLVAHLQNVTDLSPATVGPFGEFAVAGRIYTGTAPTSIGHCDTQVTQVIEGVIHFFCTYSSYAHFVALHQAQLALQPIQIAYAATIGPAIPLAPLPYAPQPFSSGTLLWDSGLDVLPGE